MVEIFNFYFILTIFIVTKKINEIKIVVVVVVVVFEISLRRLSITLLSRHLCLTINYFGEHISRFPLQLCIKYNYRSTEVATKNVQCETE